MTQNVYPSKVWKRRPEASTGKAPDLGEVARQLDTYRLWPILDLVEGPGFLTADHVGALLLPELERATKSASGRLKRLLDLGVIDAFRFSRANQPGRGGSSPLVYCLTKLGATALAAHRGVSAGDLNWHDQERMLHTFNICHRLDTVDFHVALAYYCRTTGLTLTRFDYEPRYELAAKGGVLRPDALAEVTGPDMTPLSIFLELDRDTERPRRFAERTERYERFYVTREWERWLLAPPTVLVVASQGGEERVAALRQATAQALEDGKMVFRRYRFTAIDWLYQVERSSKGFAPAVQTAFGEPRTIRPTGDTWTPLIGGGGAE